jgi:hypothetical protein
MIANSIYADKDKGVFEIAKKTIDFYKYIPGACNY